MLLLYITRLYLINNTSPCLRASEADVIKHNYEWYYFSSIQSSLSPVVFAFFDGLLSPDGFAQVRDEGWEGG